MKKLIKKLFRIDKLIDKIDAEKQRDAFIQKELKIIEAQKVLLDAGCGNQKYRKFCKHLLYKTQDLGEYTQEEKLNISSNPQPNYEIGPLDYKGNVWEINESTGYFDVIMCTEVFEHIPYPIQTLQEFSRLLKKDGKLILTCPAASNRHFDPFYFYSGFSDRWLTYFLKKYGFGDIKIIPIGDYFSYILINLISISINSNWTVRFLLAPAIFCLSKMKKTQGSINYQCNGYFVTAHRQ